MDVGGVGGRMTAAVAPVELERARQPVQPPVMPPASALVTLATSPVVHRLLPKYLAAQLGRAHGWATWHTRPHERERARAAMSAIVGRTDRAHEIERLARRHVLEMHAVRMLFWQPIRTAEVDEASRANLQETLSSGRGILFSGSHLGPFFDLSAPLMGLPRRRYSINGPWFFAPPSADYGGRRLVQWWRRTAQRDGHPIHASNSYQTVRALLEDGEIVMVTFDIPGSRETMFLGKWVSLASGTARLAFDADALILPARTRRVRGRSHVDIAQPLDCRNFADAAALHDALADIHSKLILELAETLEDPRRAGVWGQGATAEAWSQPPRGAAAPAS